MKAEINEEGVLTITPDTGLEVYALGKWAEENMDGSGTMNTMNILICRKDPTS